MLGILSQDIETTLVALPMLEVKVTLHLVCPIRLIIREVTNIPTPAPLSIAIMVVQQLELYDV